MTTPTGTEAEHVELLAKQVASWRKEIARLQDLIDHATGSTSTEAGFDLDKHEPFTAAELDEIEAVARAAPQMWYGTYQIVDGISDEKAVELIEACSPDTILTLIALARRAAPATSDMPDTTASALELFKQWKAYPLPEFNDDGNFDWDWLHREWVAFKAGLARVSLAPVSAQPCQWPTCQPERVQQEVAAQVHRELYSGESAPVSAQQGAAEQQVEFPHDFRKWDLKREDYAPPPFAAPASLLNADELAALRRFDECAQDGEGYDVPKEMMQRLAEIGVVRRKSGAYYESTDFGQYVLARRCRVQGGNTNPPLAYIPPHVMESLRNGCRVGTVLEPKPENGCTEALYGR